MTNSLLNFESDERGRLIASDQAKARKRLKVLHAKFEAKRMIDTRNFVTINEDEQYQLPPPPRFDHDASANAQPVQPLPIGGIALWAQRFRDARGNLGGRVKPLALVVISGLTIGAASGAMLASRHQASVFTRQSIVETETSTEETLPARDVSDAEGSAMAMQGAVQAVRIRRHRSSLRAPGRPRAYRVAVLK